MSTIRKMQIIITMKFQTFKDAKFYSSKNKTECRTIQSCSLTYMRIFKLLDDFRPFE